GRPSARPEKRTARRREGWGRGRRDAGGPGRRGGPDSSRSPCRRDPGGSASRARGRARDRRYRRGRSIRRCRTWSLDGRREMGDELVFAGVPRLPSAVYRLPTQEGKGYINHARASPPTISAAKILTNSLTRDRGSFLHSTPKKAETRRA